MVQTIACNKISTGALHPGHQADTNGRAKGGGIRSGIVRLRSNGNGKSGKVNSEAHPVQGDEDRERVAKLISENAELRTLLRECFQVQQASHRLRFSIFGDSLRKRVERFIKGA